MFYLIGSIILTSYLTLSFKALERLGIPVLQSIVFNYWVCVIVGSVVNGHFPVSVATISEGWFLWACLMGFVFIALFNLIAWVTQHIGIAVSSVANKMSLVIPFLFSIYLYNEKASAWNIAGILVALAAVLLTCWPQKKEALPAHRTFSPVLLFLMPAILFAGSGLLDTMIKYVEHSFLNENNHNDYLISAFAVAALIGTGLLIYMFGTGRQKFDTRSVAAGIAIGIPNYFSIWCLVTVLKQFAGKSSAIIPINNMGIVLFSAVMAYILFKEKLSWINVTGIVLAIGAIALIAFG